MHYYNEFNPDAAQWLRELIQAGCLPPGDVDERDIREVQPSELAGFTSWHFFAGIGGWPLALRMAGWPTVTTVTQGSPETPEQQRQRGANTGLTLVTAAHWADGQIANGSGAVMKHGGQFNASLARWLMGYPIIWDLCAIKIAPSSRRSRRTK